MKTNSWIDELIKDAINQGHLKMNRMPDCRSDLYNSTRYKTRPNKICWGLLFNPTGVWVGIHYSRHTRRFCINLIPCFTLWITKKYGILPSEGKDIIRKVRV